MREAIGFGVGDFFGGGQLALISTYLTLFWTRFCGMNIATAQGVIGLSAMISALSALVFGVLDDNLYRFHVGRRFGRRRLMLMLIAPSLLVGVLLCVAKTNLSRKERIYCVFAYLPKATVQAAIGSAPLAAGLPCGKLVLSVAVLAIVITAPLGAELMDVSAPRLLRQEKE